jgi:hypothetical protein
LENQTRLPSALGSNEQGKEVVECVTLVEALLLDWKIKMFTVAPGGSDRFCR